MRAGGSTRRLRAAGRWRRSQHRLPYWSGGFRGAAEKPPAASGRTVGELLTAAEERLAQRQQRIRAREAADHRRREQAAAAAREQRLDAMARDPKKVWIQVDALIETKKPKDYDTAVALLMDLQGLAGRDESSAAFAQQVQRLRAQHARKPSLLDRFDRAGLK